jgi:hypothetical protein
MAAKVLGLNVGDRRDASVLLRCMLGTDEEDWCGGCARSIFTHDDCLGTHSWISRVLT